MKYFFLMSYRVLRGFGVLLIVVWLEDLGYLNFILDFFFCDIFEGVKCLWNKKNGKYDLFY